MRHVPETGWGATATGPGPCRAEADRRFVLGLLAAAATVGVASFRHPGRADAAGLHRASTRNHGTAHDRGHLSRQHRAHPPLAYTLVGGLLTYGVLRLQAHLPGNPNGYGDVPPGLSFNTAISFMTNTNWQNYSGESTMSELSQMLGLVWHQFTSAAGGMALAAAFIRCLVRRRRNTLGDF